MSRKPTVESFLRDVVHHRMTVLLDDRLHRHLRFAQPRSGNMWFELVTWPGHLCIGGDMGTWVFSRVPDMFTFFRNDKLEINHSYWAEKLQCGRSEAQEFSAEAFGDGLLDQIKNHYGLEGEKLQAVSDAVRREVLCHDERHDLITAAADFEGPHEFKFDPCELPRGLVWTYRFTWCLYAIVWGIQQYDEFKGSQS